MIALEDKPRRRLGTYTRRSGQHTLIETYHDGYQINASAAFIWARIGGGETVSEISDSLAEAYGLDAEIAREVVVEFIGSLVRLGFVDPVNAEA